MEGRATLPLQGHQIFATRDAEQARAFVATRGFLLDIPPRQALDLDMRLNGVFLPNLFFGRVQYGAEVEIRIAQDRDEYRFIAHWRGRVCGTIAKDDVSCRRGTAMLISPTLGNLVRHARGTAGLNILLSGFVVRRQLAALLGEPQKGPLEFAPSLSLRQGHGRSLARLAHFVIAELERPDSVLLDPITAGSFREFVTAALLLHQPHNYSERLRRLQRPVAPRDVKRAINYMHANLDTTIGLPDIVAACGVPGRTLIKHFRDFKGISPMHYLRNARYEKVREALRRAGPEESVTEIALQWGFTHMGRFSIEYRKRFGESPSHTLRRRNPTIPVADFLPAAAPAQADPRDLD